MIDLDNRHPDFTVIETSNAAETAHVLRYAATERLAREGFSPMEHVQCLIPMRKGVAGVEAVNAALQAVLNPSPQGTLDIYERRFGTGDRVIQTRNNYNLDIFNGDIGRLLSIDRNEKKLGVRFLQRAVKYPFGQTNDLLLAYCITVHRSQGSEYPAVVIALDKSHTPLLSRRLLYTAITRGQHRVFLVGSLDSIRSCLENKMIAHRHTHLVARMSARLRHF
jgi:exodeoxyribonuclease V alpha subunit